ncbi:MAG: hypothetical protein KatS3mg008_1592 [Acidimicrobiales bacterium]|nr:MAG: hypothetical protein KatS3mg008_1592 [Acidimicrobiales bacterium]
MGRPEPDARLPIKLEPVSNGEFYPTRNPPAVREAIRRSYEQADRNARRLGISRRRFMQSLPAAALVLYNLSACSREEKRAREGRDPGGKFDVPPEATIEEDAAKEVLTGDEFIMDVQTHFLDFDLTKPPEEEPLGIAGFFGSLSPHCADVADKRECFAMETFLEELFIRSDTDIAVLSALPYPGDANQLPPDAMEEAIRVVEALCNDDRLLMHVGAYPHVGRVEAALDAMTEARERYDVAAWKIYTMVPAAAAFYFDDHDPDRPQIGQRFIDHVREIGPPIICTHKGFGAIVGGSAELASPEDIGPAAARNPDIEFVVYHSGYEPGGGPEGPYEGVGDRSINRLIKSLEDAGVEPGSNVYAELGSTWQNVMRDPDAAAHTIGKLLRWVGEDNVLWGTDAIWFGTPQDQIQAFRTFSISEEFQEKYGYPALTDEVKRKIFGLNAARLYGVEPRNLECRFSREDLEAARAELAVGRVHGPTSIAEAARLIAVHQARIIM